jgi:alkyl sulfatase BDS1-like metallo-beta-lactamase superfamily hydrolase
MDHGDRRERLRRQRDVAAPAMAVRVLLQRNPFGHVDQAIGKNVANGNTGLIAPNRSSARTSRR